MNKNHILLILACFVFINVFAQENQKCQIDTVYYKSFHTGMAESLETVEEYEELIKTRRPEMYWAEVYNEGKVIKRIFGKTLIGNNRTQDFIYEGEKLIEIVHSGGATSSINYEYNIDGLLSKCIVTRFKQYKDTITFEYVKDTIIATNYSNGKLKVETIILDDKYVKSKYPHGNHIVYDEIYFLRRNDIVNKYSCQYFYDECNSIRYFIEIDEDFNRIWQIFSYEIKYK